MSNINILGLGTVLFGGRLLQKSLYWFRYLYYKYFHFRFHIMFLELGISHYQAAKCLDTIFKIINLKHQTRVSVESQVIYLIHSSVYKTCTKARCTPFPLRGGTQRRL